MSIITKINNLVQGSASVYSMVPSGWRGDYNRDTRTYVYQGPAVAPNGQRAFVMIYGQDRLPVQQKTFTRKWSAFRYEDGILWSLAL